MAVQFILPDSKSVSQPPSTLAYIVDRTFFFAAAAGALAIIVLVVYILWEIGGQALPAIGRQRRLFPREYPMGRAKRILRDFAANLGHPL